MFDIRFQVLPEELETRFRSALKALEEGTMTDLKAVEFFFKYFFQRLDPMYRDNPKVAQIIKEAVKKQIVGFIVPKLIDVTLDIETISDLRFTKGVSPRSPALIFSDLDSVVEIVLARTTFVEILIAKKLKVKKMAKILRWLAPISTIQTKEMLQKVREEDLAILDRLLQEIDY